ncbi:hypothetical protein ACSTKX_25030, partial [Vibrio parahaemolyticus]
MLKFLGKLLGGNKSEKDVAKILPVVQKINQYYQEYQSLSNDDLRNKTADFKKRIADHLQDIDGKIAAKKSEADQLPVEDIHGKDTIYR